MTAPGIEVRNLSLHFGDRRLFDNLSLTVPGGQWVSLLGASGAGKTSLLRVMAGLAPATCGEVVASDGKPIPGRLAWMGQKDLLYPWLSVRENVALGARLRGEKVDHARVATLLEQVELASCADARPATLSGGMRQRAALARTLYEDRPIVLMDEPFSALDTLTRTRIQTLAATLLAGRTVVLSSFLLVTFASSWVFKIGNGFSDAAPDGVDVSLSMGMLFNPWVFLIALCVCFLLNLMSALWPAWRASRRPIVDSLNA